MKISCILCGRPAEENKPTAGKGEHYIECQTCKNYFYDPFFQRAYKSMDEYKGAMFSAYTRECYETGVAPPKLGDPDLLEDKILEYRNKSIKEKINSLILYLKKNSNYLGEKVSWDKEEDYPITYSSKPEEFIEIISMAKRRNLIRWPSSDSSLELTGNGWEYAERLEKELNMQIGKASNQLLKALYEVSQGNENSIHDIWDIGKSLGFENSLANRIGQYLKGEEFILYRTEQGEISITHKGIKKVEEELSQHSDADQKDKIINDVKADPKKVFVVCGRNDRARRALFDFLRSIGLDPIEWDQAIKSTGKGSPFIGEVLDEAFDRAQAIVVLITGDDMARLKDKYIKDDDPDYEKNLTPQARPNVIFEAGLAFGRCSDRTVMVVLEKENTRLFSDIFGRHLVKLSNSPESRMGFISRLNTAGCKIDTEGRKDWIDTGDFEEVIDQGYANSIKNKIDEDKKKESEKVQILTDCIKRGKSLLKNFSSDDYQKWDSRVKIALTKFFGKDSNICVDFMRTGSSKTNRLQAGTEERRMYQYSKAENQINTLETHLEFLE